MGKEFTTRSALLLLIFVVLGVYYPAIFSPLNSVDDPGMYDYLLNADGVTFRGIFFPGGSGAYYRPVLGLTYLADKYVWGLEESFMHLENILFHLLNAVLVFLIARKCSNLQERRSPLLPLCASLLFAVHPINTEAVNWISGRTDPLAASFILLSVLLIIGERSVARSCLSAFSLLVACLAKETAVFFLPAAVILPFFRGVGSDAASLRKTFSDYRWHFTVFTGTAVAYFSFRARAFSRGDNGVHSVVSHVAGGDSAGILINLRLIFKAAGFYLKKLIQPFPLNFGINHVSDLYLPVGVLLLAVVLWLLRRRTLPAFFFVAAAAVGSSALLVPLLKLTWTPLAERYMYIPSAFFVVGLTLCGHDWKYRVRHPRFFLALVGVVFAVFLYGTASRTILWQDNLALFQDTVRKSPDFAPAQNEVACALFANGREAEASAMMMSLRLPDNLVNFQLGLMNKAFACRQKGDFQGARNFLYQALKNPGKHEADICLNLLKVNEAELERGKGDRAALYPESARLLTRLYQMSGNPFYQYRLGQLHLFQHERSLARAAFARAAEEAPASAVYREPARKLSEKLK